MFGPIAKKLNCERNRKLLFLGSNIQEHFSSSFLTRPLIDEQDHTNKLQIVKSRGVLWPYSQPSAPMETLYAEVEDLEKAYPYGPAYVDSAGKVIDTKYHKK